VTVFALHRRVRAQQREAILVILHLLDGDIPALNSVALRAVRAHFSLVDVGVAILAILADVGEHRLDMALHALDFFVQSAKRIPGLVVIELRHGTDGAPARSVVTVFTRNRKRTVRTTSGLPLGVRHRSTRSRPRQEYQPAQNLYAPRRKAP